MQRVRWAIAHLQLKKLRDVWKGDVERKLRSRKVGPIITCTNLQELTATTTAAAKKAGSCQMARKDTIYYTNPSFPASIEREKLSVEGLHTISMFWRAFCEAAGKVK